MPRSRHNKNLIWPCYLDLWPFDLKSNMLQAFYEVNVWYEFHQDLMIGTWLIKKVWQTHKQTDTGRWTDRQTDRQTKPSIELPAQLKSYWLNQLNPRVQYPWCNTNPALWSHQPWVSIVFLHSWLLVSPTDAMRHCMWIRIGSTSDPQPIGTRMEDHDGMSWQRL